MEIASQKEFGVYSELPEALDRRYRVSRGVTLLSGEDASRDGYRQIPNILVPQVDNEDPMLSLREPTDAEMTAIAATPETRRVMRIVRIGRTAIERLLERCEIADRSLTDSPENFEELVPGIMGIPRSVRLDSPGQLSVSISSQSPGTRTGDHIDDWANPDTSLFIANMGPGSRWHRVIPDLNRTAIGGLGRERVANYAADNLDLENIPVHWFRLDPPQGEYVEAIVDSPVAWAPHDGSTIGSRLSSLAVMCVTNPTITNEPL